MATFQGEEFTPAAATEEQTAAIQKITDMKTALKAQYEDLEALYMSLPSDTPLAANITTDGDSVMRTVIIGEPEGAYVNYKKVDFLMNAKTTKKDLKALGED
jgi:hypothetical protein